MPAPRLQPNHTALLVVDVQEKLLPHMHDAGALVSQISRLIDGVNVLNLPVLVTEQYRKGLGATAPEVAGRLGKAVCNHEKLKFSACIEPVREELAQRSIHTVLVCGIEAHVCVLQTCMDLIDHGYITAVALDAIGSRRPSDRDTAILRLVQVGVIPTTVESALLELVHEASGACFKAILPIIK